MKEHPIFSWTLVWNIAQNSSMLFYEIRCPYIDAANKIKKFTQVKIN